MKTVQITRLDTFLSRSMGLIGEKTPKAVYFKTRFGIHTFGMSFPIDVVILNDTGTVVKVKESLFPNKIFIWNPLWQHVLELPKGSIKKRHLFIGQIVQLLFT